MRTGPGLRRLRGPHDHRPSGPRLAPTDHPRHSKAIRAALLADGVTVRLGVRAHSPARLGRTGRPDVVDLDDGSTAHVTSSSSGRPDVPAGRSRARALPPRFRRPTPLPARRPAADRRRVVPIATRRARNSTLTRPTTRASSPCGWRWGKACSRNTAPCRADLHGSGGRLGRPVPRPALNHGHDGFELVADFPEDVQGLLGRGQRRGRNDRRRSRDAAARRRGDGLSRRIGGHPRMRRRHQGAVTRSTSSRTRSTRSPRRRASSTASSPTRCASWTDRAAWCRPDAVDLRLEDDFAVHQDHHRRALASAPPGSTGSSRPEHVEDDNVCAVPGHEPATIEFARGERRIETRRSQRALQRQGLIWPERRRAGRPADVLAPHGQGDAGPRSTTRSARQCRTRRPRRSGRARPTRTRSPRRADPTPDGPRSRPTRRGRAGHWPLIPLFANRPRSVGGSTSWTCSRRRHQRHVAGGRTQDVEGRPGPRRPRWRGSGSRCRPSPLASWLPRARRAA